MTSEADDLDGTPALLTPDVGRYLMRLREAADIKQADLAKSAGLSAAVLSRVESGGRALAKAELIQLLAALGTPAAAALARSLDRKWIVLPPPPLTHPDQELLWEAEQAAVQLTQMKNVAEPPERRVTEYLEELQRCANLLLKREFAIAFIGSVGIGKSTAICRIAALETPLGLRPDEPILEVGGGGITVCEVHIRPGPGYGIIVDPRDPDEIRQEVADFADYLYRPSMTSEDESAEGSESSGISSEIMRVLRNMSGLAIHRFRGPDGKRQTIDPARELASGLADSNAFEVEVLMRMNLPQRIRRDLWYEAASGKSERAWLKEQFSAINNGRHFEFSLPRRIEVVVPHPLLATDEFSVRIIDTKGIDRTVGREDLERHFNAPHTLAVLCTGFNNAPAAEAQLLLKRAKEAGAHGLSQNVALLVLPRADEALAMKDDASGIPVESEEEGYELRAEQVDLALASLGLNGLPITFFNAHRDPTEATQQFFLNRLHAIGEAFRQRLVAATHGARSLSIGHETDRIKSVITSVESKIRNWLVAHASISEVNGSIEDSLLFQIRMSHSNTIRASIRRRGEWAHLSFSYQLGYGARRLANLAVYDHIEAFDQFCTDLCEDPQSADAIELIKQAQRVLAGAHEELLRKMQLTGQTLFTEALNGDFQFWHVCMTDRGRGYRARIASYNRDWFEAEARRPLAAQLRASIQNEWRRALNSVLQLLEPTLDATAEE